VITTGWRHRQRHGLRLTTVLALVLLALVAAGPAAAGSSCGDRVIDDWNADGRVDGTYALHCYDDAIEALPRDVRDYSSAKEDIERAMQDAMRQGPATGTGDDPTTGSGGSGGRGNGGGTGGTGGPSPGDTPGDTSGTPEASPDVDPASDSIPIPLLVLAALALLLVAGGSVGYVVRRLQARRVPPASL